MEQRPLRLGDIVDDYCPRERRISNHAIVVMSREQGLDVVAVRVWETPTSRTEYSEVTE